MASLLFSDHRKQPSIRRTIMKLVGSPANELTETYLSKGEKGYLNLSPQNFRCSIFFVLVPCSSIRTLPPIRYEATARSEKQEYQSFRTS